MRSISDLTIEELRSDDPSTIGEYLTDLALPLVRLRFDRIFLKVTDRKDGSLTIARIPYSGDPKLLFLRPTFAMCPTRAPKQQLEGRITRKHLELEIFSTERRRRVPWNLVQEKVELASEYDLGLIYDLYPLYEELRSMAYQEIERRLGTTQEDEAA